MGQLLKGLRGCSILGGRDSLLLDVSAASDYDPTSLGLDTRLQKVGIWAWWTVILKLSGFCFIVQGPGDEKCLLRFLVECKRPYALVAFLETTSRDPNLDPSRSYP